MNIPDTNYNPGNLRYAGQPGAVDDGKGFAKFQKEEDGMSALMNDLQAKVSGNSTTGLNGDSKLYEFTQKYAPQADKNNPGQYAADLSNWLGVRPDTPLKELQNRIPDFAQAVARKEGYTKAQGFQSQQGGYVTTPAPDVALTGQDKTQEPGFVSQIGQDLSNRANDAGQTIQQTMSGQINPVSGLIQTVGAVAGGLGDIVNTVLEKTPIVGSVFKGIEGLIGKGTEMFFNTSVGKSVAKSLGDFSTQHPELSKDIGAGINIITAIPILKGIGEVADITMNTAAKVLAKKVTNILAKDTAEVLSRTMAGRELLQTVPNGVDTLIKNKAFLDFDTVDGVTKYNTENANAVINKTISDIDTNELQPILQEVSAKQNFGQNLGTLKKMAINEAENDSSLKEAGMVPKAIQQIENRFNGWQYSYGDKIDLATENRLKIGSGKFSDWGTPEGSADKVIYKTFQQNIENIAKQNGLSDVNAINGKIKELIKSKDLLDAINGKTVKNTGLLHQVIKGSATAGGAAVGTALGGNTVPGTVIGYGASGYLENKLAGLAPRAFARRVLTQEVKAITGQSVKRIGGMIGSALAQKASKQ